MKWIFFIVIACLQLMGCSSSPTEQSKKQTTISLSLFASSDVNPNVLGKPSPLEVQVYELEDDSMLMSAGYDQIKKDDKAVLKSNYVKRYDYVLTPSQFKFVNSFKINSDTNYIGVVANFSNPGMSEWKKVIKIINKGREYHALIYLRDFDVILDKVE